MKTKSYTALMKHASTNRATTTTMIGMMLAIIMTSGIPAPGQDQELDDLFPSDRVIMVEIEVDEDDWDEIRFQTREFMEALSPSRQFEPVESPYSYVEANVTIDGVRHERVGLRKKGFIGSQDKERPSLKVKLDYTEKGHDIGGVNTLTFNNNKQDRSLLSQYLTYGIFDAAGSPGSRCGYAQVIVNGRNLGVYSHVESVKPTLLEREFGSADGVLYEGTVTDFYPEWEDSFELKSGSRKKGRRKIEQLVKAINPDGGKVVLEGGTLTRVSVPNDDSDDLTWFLNDFDDSAWRKGVGGTGYETQSGYERMIGPNLDVRDAMFDEAGSVHVRIPFEIDDLDAIRNGGDLTLGMRFDDGFVAYLNGEEIARANAPTDVAWNSIATGPNSDGAAVRFARFKLGEKSSLLREGENLLAIQVLNVARDSTDLLCVAELTVDDHDIIDSIWELVDEDAFYRFWALEGLLSFWDGYSGNRNNFFIYLDPESGKFRFMPWGTDALFETYGPLGEDRSSPRSVRTQGLIGQRLYQDPDARRRYAEELRLLLDEHWDEEAMIAETERVEAMLAPHLCRSQEFEVDYGGLRDFIRTRREVVEAEIAGGEMPEWPAPAAGPAFIGPGGFGPGESDAESDPFIAAKNGDIDNLRRHLRDGTDVNFSEPGRNSLLNMAAMGGDPETIAFMVRRGAKTDIRNDDGGTPLHSAAFLGNTEAIRALLEAGADINARNQRGETPLMVASAPWNDDLALIVEFVKVVVGLEQTIEDVRRNRPAGARLLEESGGTAAVPEMEEGKIGFADNALREAIRSGDMDALQTAITTSDDLDQRDEMGITPLNWAALTDNLDALRMLLESGADIDATNDDGGTPLHAASFLGRIRIVEALLEADADTSLRNRDGGTALEGASVPWGPWISGIIDWVKRELRLDLDIDQVKDGRRQSAAVIEAMNRMREDQVSEESNTG